MNWQNVDWGKVFNYAYLVAMGACMVVNIYMTLRVYRSGKKAVKADREYIEAIGKALAQLKANPQGWLDHMGFLDDKRRHH